MSGRPSLPFESRPNGLIIRLNNRDILEKKADTIRGVAELIKAHSAKVVLVDFRGIPGEVSFLDRYQMGEAAARLLPKVRLAVLIDAERADPGRIGIVVAANRGAHITLFTEEAEAEAWFKKGGEAESPPSV